MPKAMRASIIRAEANEPVKPATMLLIKKMESENNVPKFSRVKSTLASNKDGVFPRKAFTDLRNTNIPLQSKENVKSEKPSFDDAVAPKLTKCPSIERFPAITEESDDELPLFVSEEERHTMSQMNRIFVPAPKPPFDYSKLEETSLNLEFHEVEICHLNHWNDLDDSPLMMDDSKIPLPTFPF